LGFDVRKATNVEILSYLGVTAHFMPRNSIGLQDLDPSVRTCIQRRERCTGYLFKLERRQEQRVGNVALDALSFSRTTVTSGWSAEALFLVENGTVMYKLLSGSPKLDTVRERVQPLGPLQDLTGAAARLTIDSATP